MKKVTPVEDEAYARELVDLLRQGDFDKIEQDLDPSVAGPGVDDSLSKMSALFPVEEPKSVKVVNLRKVFNDKSATTQISLEYEFTSGWLVADIATNKTDGKAKITALHVMPIPDALENTNAFTFHGKGPSQFFGLLLAVGASLFSLDAFVLCWRAKSIRYKWLWCVLTLCGAVKFAVNWTTGEWSITPLAINLPCVGVTAVPPYAPWIVSIFLPVGAILFFAKCRIGPNEAPPKLEYPPPRAIGD